MFTSPPRSFPTCFLYFYSGGRFNPASVEPHTVPALLSPEATSLRDPLGNWGSFPSRV